MAERNLALVLKARDEASATLSKLNRELGNTGVAGSKMGDALHAGAMIGVAGIGALAVGLGAAVKAAADAQLVHAQLDAVLKSTGGAAGITKAEVEGLADSLSKLTPFEDEAILSGQNLLLTFTSIGKDIFPQATETMLNMSQALGQDLKSSAIQLGKALQDPILGVTALRRVGVNFNEAQTDVIKGMVEMGNLAGAQAAILKELEIEFGGAAKAAGQTFAGQLAIAKTALGNVMEEIGGRLLPVLTPLIGQFAQALPRALDIANAALDRLWAVIQPGIEILGILFASVRAIIEGKGFDILYDQINKAFGPEIGAQIAAVVEFLNGVKVQVVALIAIGAGLVKFFQDNELAAQALGSVIAAVLLIQVGAAVVAFTAWAVAAGVAAIATALAMAPFVALAVVIATVILAGVKVVENWELITFVAKTMTALVGMAFDVLGTKIHEVLSRIGERILAFVNKIVESFNGFRNQVIAIFQAIAERGIVYWVGFAIGKALSFFMDMVTEATANAQSLLNQVGAILSNLPGMVGGWALAAYNAIIAWFEELPGKAKELFSAMWDMISHWLRRTVNEATDQAYNIVRGIHDWLSSLPDRAQRWFGNLWQSIRNMAGTAVEAAKSLGEAIVNGIREGFENFFGGLAAGFMQRVRDLLQGLRDALMGGMSQAQSVARSAIITRPGPEIRRGVPVSRGAILGFQHGGIVPGIGPQLAVVHGGERITPRGRAAISVNITIGGSVIGILDLEDKVRKAVRDGVLAGGFRGTIA